MSGKIAGVELTPLKVIQTPGGDVYHAMKATDPGYAGFGEAYFSSVQPGAVKAWKRHERMTLNLVVIAGDVRFVLYDDRGASATRGQTQVETLGPKSAYSRLTVPPGIWMGFQGVGEVTGVLLNIASIPHDPGEAVRKEPGDIPFDWSSR